MSDEQIITRFLLKESAENDLLYTDGITLTYRGVIVAKWKDSVILVDNAKSPDEDIKSLKTWVFHKIKRSFIMFKFISLSPYE